MKHGCTLVGMIAVLAIAGCAGTKKVELEYEEPVTTTWTGAQPPAQPPQAAAPQQPQQQPPPPPPGTPSEAQRAQGAAPQAVAPDAAPLPQGTFSGNYPPSQYQAAPQAMPPDGSSAPGNAQAYPVPAPAPSPQPRQPPPGWRNGQPATAPPLGFGFSDPSVTTVVVPDQNPTTQTTLKKRTGWVRGGYD